MKIIKVTEMPKRLKFKYHKDGELPPGNEEYTFVFGSNESGIHGKGAALVAKYMYGAIFGQGIGLQGNSYAIPTKDRFIRSNSIKEIKKYVEQFTEFTNNQPERKFWVTGIGCGLAGYHASQIAYLFKDCNPLNCNFPHTWKPYLR